MVSEDMAVWNQVRKPDPPLGDFKLRRPPARTSSAHMHHSVYLLPPYTYILDPHFVGYVSAYPILYLFHARVPRVAPSLGTTEVKRTNEMRTRIATDTHSALVRWS